MRGVEMVKKKNNEGTKSSGDVIRRLEENLKIN